MWSCSNSYPASDGTRAVGSYGVCSIVARCSPYVRFEWDRAADLFVRCRPVDSTPANTNNLLIASVAIGNGVPLMARDADFGRIAEVSPLQLAA